MRTVKEVSELTGISVRTLHYYDEIGLLRPAERTGAGYRLYADADLDRLRQILFFREFDLPLGEIRAILEDPAMDRARVLRTQRKMLAAKKERLERLIASIDELERGEDQMDFSVFTRTEVEELFRLTLDRMPEKLRDLAVEEFGSVEEWREHYIRTVSSPKLQKEYAKVAEWYGGKSAYLDALQNPPGREVAEAFRKRETAILEKLAAKQGCPVDSFPVREIVGEYGFVMKRFFQLKEEAGMMLALADSLENERARERLAERYGPGAAAYIARAIRSFYRREGQE